MGRLDGKVAVITGATSGIGERTAERFAEEGAKVVVSGRSEEKGKTVAQRIGGGAFFHRADVGEESDVGKLVEATIERFGRLDCLFGNAGFAIGMGGIEDTTREQFDHDMNVLVGGVLWGMKYAAPIMKKQRSGSIINNASIAGHRGGYAPHLYSAAKAAVINLSRGVALELAPDNVRVNTISPGGIMTPIFGRVFGMDNEEAAKTVDKTEAALAGMHPIGRAGTTDDIANAAVYLASDESSFVTGQDLLVDGGVISGRRTAETDRIFGQLASDLGVGS